VEWLRRERRRTDAREELRAAFGMLDSMGVAAFAERARRELRATGETARKRAVGSRNDQLTPQETQIARLARDGLSNPEILTGRSTRPPTSQPGDWSQGSMISIPVPSKSATLRVASAAR
jgi:hypothetical protein